MAAEHPATWRTKGMAVRARRSAPACDGNSSSAQSCIRTGRLDFAHYAKAFPLLHIPDVAALLREDSGTSEVFIRSIGKKLAAFFGVVWAVPAAAQGALADPAGSGVIVSAVRWLEGTLLGTIATVVAVIAVASVGLLMLTGRINWRYGATVILGCFILFGAASIVAGIQSTAQLGQ